MLHVFGNPLRKERRLILRAGAVNDALSPWMIWGGIPALLSDPNPACLQTWDFSGTEKMYRLNSIEESLAIIWSRLYSTGHFRA